jgi:hypothetical protein
MAEQNITTFEELAKNCKKIIDKKCVLKGKPTSLIALTINSNIRLDIKDRGNIYQILVGHYDYDCNGKRLEGFCHEWFIASKDPQKIYNVIKAIKECEE